MILGHGGKVATAAAGGKSNTMPGEAATGSLAKLCVIELGLGFF